MNFSVCIVQKSKLYRKKQLKMTGFYALLTCERFIYILIIHSIANMIILMYEYERYSDLGLDMCIHIYNKSVAFESVLAFKDSRKKNWKQKKTDLPRIKMFPDLLVGFFHE